MRWCLSNTYDALGSVFVLTLKRRMESCQGMCPRPHPIQQVLKTGRPTMKPSNPGAVPTLMPRLGKQLPCKFSKLRASHRAPQKPEFESSLSSLPSKMPNIFFSFLPCWTPNTSVPPFWHTAQPTEHFHTDRVTHVIGWSHHKMAMLWITTINNDSTRVNAKQS